MVFVGTVAIGLTIFESSEQVEVRLVDGKYVRVDEPPAPRRRHYSDYWTTQRDLRSGRLCLRAYSPYNGASWERFWRESKAGELPGKFRAVARELEREAPVIAKLVEEAHARFEAERQRLDEQFRRWRREEAERRRAQDIKESRDELLAIVEAWSLANRIEAFFQDAGLRAAELGEEERAEVLERLRRARDLLGGTDALGRFRSWKAPVER